MESPRWWRRPSLWNSRDRLGENFTFRVSNSVPVTNVSESETQESRGASELVSTQGLQDAYAAYRKTDHGSECCDQQKVGAEVKEIGNDGADREDQT